MLACGCAGTGKSYLIDALTNLLDSHCLLTGTTGVAASNIDGCTLTSALKLHVKKLSSGRLKDLQMSLHDCQYLIIDEMSMLGQKELSRLNTRLQEIKANDQNFGGMSLILVGDFAQLPPIADPPMWKKPYNGEEKRNGFILYRQFKTYVELDQPKRQNDRKFLDLLSRVRNGELTKKDWLKLCTRNPSIMNLPSDYDEYIRLYGGNNDVTNYNLFTKLQNVGNPIAKILAEHSDKVAAMALPRNAWGLEPVLYLAVGAKVMLRKNLLTKYGLTNGAMGTVKDIIYNSGQSPDKLPRAVIVHFPEYKGTQDLIPGYPKCIPIVPFHATWNDGGKQRYRKQIPLKLAWAITIHKSQGLSLDNVVVDIGDYEIATGSTYVALSRLKTFEGLYFVGKTLDRILKLNGRGDLKLRKKEEQRLRRKEI